MALIIMKNIKKHLETILTKLLLLKKGCQGEIGDPYKINKNDNNKVYHICFCLIGLFMQT